MKCQHCGVLDLCETKTQEILIIDGSKDLSKETKCAICGNVMFMNIKRIKKPEINNPHTFENIIRRKWMVK